MPREYEGRVREFLDKARQPLAPGDPRRHHFIPQFFLKRFANDDGQVAVVDLAKPGTRRVASIEKVAVMKDLYTTIDVDIGETVAVEKVLALADSEANEAIARLALGLFFPPQPADRFSLAIWLGLLFVRDPYARRINEALADQAAKLMMPRVRDNDTARVYLREKFGEEPTAEEIKVLLDAVSNLDSLEMVPHQNLLVRMMLDSALAIASHLLDRRFVLFRFPEPGLVLPDRPMLLYQRPQNRSPSRGVGIATADEIWMPLDRSRALILHRDPTIVEEIIDAPEWFTVEAFNQNVILGANAEIYCHPDDLHGLKQLKLPDPNRPLFEMSGGPVGNAESDGVNKPPARKRHHRYRRQD